MTNQFRILLKNKQNIYIGMLIAAVFVVPFLVYIGYFGKYEWYEEEQVYSVLYQFIFVLLSGVAFVLFLQDVVEEKGREIFYVSKRMYLGEAGLFMALDELVLLMSTMISGEVSEICKEGFVFVSVENILVLGLMYLILYMGSSATLAIGALVLLLIHASMYLSDVCIMVYISDDYSQMIEKSIYLLGIGICSWALGALANLYYTKYD